MTLILSAIIHGMDLMDRSRPVLYIFENESNRQGKQRRGGGGKQIIVSDHEVNRLLPLGGECQVGLFLYGPFRVLQESISILSDFPWRSNHNNLMTHNISGVLKSHFPGATLEFDPWLGNENGDDDKTAERWWWCVSALIRDRCYM